MSSKLIITFIALVSFCQGFAKEESKVCEAKFKKYETIVEIAEKIDKYVLIPKEIIEGGLKTIEKTKNAYQDIKKAKDKLHGAKTKLDELRRITTALEEATEEAPEAEVALVIGKKAEIVIRNEIALAERGLGEVEKPFSVFISDLTKIAPKLKFVLKELAIDGAIKNADKIIEISKNQCEKEEATKKVQCVSNYLDKMESEVSKYSSSTQKFIEKFNKVAKPAIEEQQKLIAELSKLTGKIESIEQKIDKVTHMTKLFGEFKEKLHSKIHITLKWPSVTHPSHLAHKKVEFSVYGILKSVKNEITSVVSALGKEARSAFNELIKITGLKSFEIDLIGKAKKAIGAVNKELSKITEKDFPIIAKIEDQAKKTTEQVIKTSKLTKLIMDLSFESLHIPNPNLFSQAEIKRQCAL